MIPKFGDQNWFWRHNFEVPKQALYQLIYHNQWCQDALSITIKQIKANPLEILSITQPTNQSQHIGLMVTYKYECFWILHTYTYSVASLYSLAADITI